MANIFTQGTGRKSFDGYLLYALDASTLGTVYEFADESIQFGYDLNNSYPDLIDGLAYMINRVTGLPVGSLRSRGVWQGDRGLAAMVNAAFGPRTAGKLTPWVGNIVPFSGGAVRKFAGLWWNTFTMTGQFGVSGADSMIRHEMTGIIVDPAPLSTVPTMTPPASLGTTGAGISSFAKMSFTDGQSSPTVYDNVKSFQLQLSNRLDINPSTEAIAGGRVASGCTPGTIIGRLMLEQLGNASVPLPTSVGTYPMQLVIPTGDGSASTKVDVSVSYDADNSSFGSNVFQTNQLSYTVFGISAGNTTTAGWPVVLSYA